MFCRPALKLEPTLAVGPLAGARVVDVTSGGVRMTGGWVELHFDVVDQLSPGMRPDALDSYTHKLDLALLVFNWLPAGNWLRNVELEASLDYLATGLPRHGDVIDGERYLEDARGWSVSFLLVMPLAPLVPQ